MNAEELAELCKAESSGGTTYPNCLRIQCYRDHWPVIRDAVKEHGARLYTAIRVLRTKLQEQNGYKEAGDGKDPFGDRKMAAVFQAYRRACIAEGIKLKRN